MAERKLNINLLLNEEGGEEHLLETDIMRFMAIIGIVFWIIFSLVKTMPLYPQKDDNTRKQVAITPAISTVASKAIKKTLEKSAQKPVEKPVKKQTEESRFMPVKEALKPVKPIAKQGAKRAKKKSAARRAFRRRRGITIEFRSRDDLLELMKAGRVQLYALVRAPGFNFIFKGENQSGNLRFNMADSLPNDLWEMKSGNAHDEFLSMLKTKNPPLDAFPEKRIFVKFYDKGLEKDIDATLQRLRAEKKDGVIYICKEGTIKYEGFKEDEGDDE